MTPTRLKQGGRTHTEREADVIDVCPYCGDRIEGTGFGRHTPEVWAGLWWHRGCVSEALVRAEENR